MTGFAWSLKQEVTSKGLGSRKLEMEKERQRQRMWKWKEPIIFTWLSFFFFTKVENNLYVVVLVARYAQHLYWRSSRVVISKMGKIKFCPKKTISRWSCKSIFILISVLQIFDIQCIKVSLTTKNQQFLFCPVSELSGVDYPMLVSPLRSSSMLLN